MSVQIHRSFFSYLILLWYNNVFIKHSVFLIFKYNTSNCLVYGSFFFFKKALLLIYFNDFSRDLSDYLIVYLIDFNIIWSFFCRVSLACDKVIKAACTGVSRDICKFDTIHFSSYYKTFIHMHHGWVVFCTVFNFFWGGKVSSLIIIFSPCWFKIDEFTHVTL